MKPEIREHLITLQETDYAVFTASLTPGAGEVLGIRLPRLREYAKELAAGQGEAALMGEDRYFEEKLLRGMLIGILKVSPERRFALMREFIPHIDNWSVCDTLCCSLKSMKRQQEACWDFLQPYALSEQEFEQRFAAVMLRGYFVTEDYIDSTLALLRRIRTDAYYASMGVAWALTDCYIKFPEKTLPLLKEGGFDPSTRQRAVRKLCDSFRVSQTDKQMLRDILSTTSKMR